MMRMDLTSVIWLTRTVSIDILSVDISGLC